MHGRTASFSACLLIVLAALCAPLASGAGSPSGLLNRADSLRHSNASLASRSRGAVLSLYALDTRLERVRAQLAALRDRAARLERARAEVASELRVAQRALTISERRLAERLRALYEQDDIDPVAIILGATSLDDAVSTLDDLSRTAQQNRDVIRQTLDARRRLRAASRGLSARQAEVGRATAAAAQSAAQLAGARSERTAYLARLARQRQLNAHELASLQASAAAAEVKAATLNTSGGAAPAAAPTAAPTTTPATGTPSAGGRTITVVSTGYALTGRTATGVPVGWGVVAVDPSLIPLGTHLTIPGYGEGVAADTGSAVRGAVIDLWFPTLAQARGWGRRVVTISLH